MRIGFLGLSGSGKSTLFAAIEGRGRIATSRAPETRTGVVRVPDSRVDHLSAIFSPRKTTYAEIAFVDPSGERGPDEPRGALSEAVLAAVRAVDALVLVVRAFADQGTAGAAGCAAAAADLQRLEDELMLRDLERVEARLQRLQKEGKKTDTAAERTLLERLHQELESEHPLREIDWTEDQLVRLRGFQFLSLKPALVVVNIGEADLGERLPLPEERPGRHVLALSAHLEHELAALEPAERREYLDHLGLVEGAQGVFVRGAFRLLDLISFFTVGEDEVRAWPVRRGAPAPVAAGKIHSDLQKGFIRAEVIHYDDFVRVGSLGAARTQGLLRLEGKNYEVRDGDIMHVRHA